MFEQKLILNNINDVMKFVEIASSKDYDIELISDEYTVNAKSINDVFSLDLTKPVTVRAHCENNGEIIKQIVPFVVRIRK